MGLTFLNGLLAFAVTMIVMSTVMAAIVEFIYTVRAKRQRYLRAYLLDFFDTQLLPSFEQKIVQLATEAPERIRGSSTTSESNRLVGWVISPLLALREPTIWAILRVIFLSIALIYFTAWTETLIAPAIVFILVYFCWDQHSQDSKLNQGIDKATSEKLGLSPETRKQLDSFRQNFVDEIAKQGTDPENGKDYAERITPTEFASALGRSELGEILVQTGRDKLDLLITDLLRRFDNTGAMSLAEFKRKSTKLSVFAAFITAFVVNINAISLLAAYFADDDLSARVIALYSEEELAGMAETLNAVENQAYAELVEKQKELNEKQEELNKNQEDLKKIQDAEAKTNSPKDATDLEETIREAEAEIERLRSEINGTVATLTAIGTPVGWRYFPFCLPDASGRHPGVMPGCQGLSPYSALLAKIEKSYLPADGQGEQAEEAQPNAFTCARARNAAKDRLADDKGYLWIKPVVIVCDHWDTTWQWLGERKHNFLSWLMGVLLAGVLIGLGGPFWFDFYRRLATVTQIARSFGVAQPKQKKSQQDSSPPPKADDPQTKHTPDSAVEAFEEAVEAKRVMTDVPAPRRLLNADGT